MASTERPEQVVRALLEDRPDAHPELVRRHRVPARPVDGQEEAPAQDEVDLLRRAPPSPGSSTKVDEVDRRRRRARSSRARSSRRCPRRPAGGARAGARRRRRAPALGFVRSIQVRLPFAATIRPSSSTLLDSTSCPPCQLRMRMLTARDATRPARASSAHVEVPARGVQRRGHRDRDDDHGPGARAAPRARRSRPSLALVADRSSPTS